jgi:hypothetical protein
LLVRQRQEVQEVLRELTMAPLTIGGEINRYLRTGETDDFARPWPGDLTKRGKRAHQDLRGALIAEVRRRTTGKEHHPIPTADTVAFTRQKIGPMVRGLFTRAEQDTVFATLERSVVFLTSENIDAVLMEHDYDSSAWALANLYVGAAGAKLLGKTAPNIVGLSEHIRCFVSPDYFRDGDPFADFVVHEVAHVFHNCKRRTIGLHETRTREWLLEVAYVKRETFAYSCEAYARILERAATGNDRRALAAEYATRSRISDERVDPGEVASIVQAAVESRNGWKVILARCAPPLQVSRAQWIRDQVRLSMAERGVSRAP